MVHQNVQGLIGTACCLGEFSSIKLFFGLLACRPSKEDKMDRPKESLLDSQKVPVDIEKEARRLKMQNIVVSLQCISG